MNEDGRIVAYLVERIDGKKDVVHSDRWVLTAQEKIVQFTERGFVVTSYVVNSVIRITPLCEAQVAQLTECE